MNKMYMDDGNRVFQSHSDAPSHVMGGGFLFCIGHMTDPNLDSDGQEMTLSDWLVQVNVFQTSDDRGRRRGITPTAHHATLRLPEVSSICPPSPEPI